MIVVRTSAAVIVEANEISWAVGVGDALDEWSARLVWVSDVAFLALAFLAMALGHTKSVRATRMVFMAGVFARVIKTRFLVGTIAVVEALLPRAFGNAAAFVSVAVRAIGAFTFVRALVVSALGAVAAGEWLLLALVHVCASPVKHHHVALWTRAVAFTVCLVAVNAALVLRARMR